MSDARTRTKAAEPPKGARRRPPAEDVSQRLEVEGDFNRREAEALRVEIWGLARRHKIQLRGLRVEPAD